MARASSVNGDVRPYRFCIHAANLIADAQHLTPEAFGCYMRLLLSYWRLGAPCDDDVVLARIVGLPVPRWRAIRPRLEPFFEVRGGQWLHAEMDDELFKACEAIKTNRSRTQAATAARLAKTRRQRDDARDVVPNESVRTLSPVPVEPPAQAKEEKSDAPHRFADDVAATERALGIGGGA